MSYLDRVKFSAAAAGTGSFVVATPVTGFLTPAQSGMPDGQAVSYVAFSSDQTQWEYGHSTYAVASTSIARSPINSSNGGAPVAFTAAPTVAICILAEDIPTQSGLTVATGNVELYVNGSAGSDSNNGLSLATPVKTISRALQIATTFNYVGAYSAIVNVAYPNTYTELPAFPVLLGQAGNSSIIGNPSNTAQCIIDARGGGLSINANASWKMSGITIYFDVAVWFLGAGASLTHNGNVVWEMFPLANDFGNAFFCDTGAQFVNEALLTVSGSGAVGQFNNFWNLAAGVYCGISDGANFTWSANCPTGTFRNQWALVPATSTLDGADSHWTFTGSFSDNGYTLDGSIWSPNVDANNFPFPGSSGQIGPSGLFQENFGNPNVAAQAKTGQSAIDVQVSTAGGTVVVPSWACIEFINNSSLYSSLTVEFTINRQRRMSLTSKSGITSLTLTSTGSAGFVGAPTSLGANSSIAFIYRDVDNNWYLAT